jgi:hypothetical protein
MREPFAHQHRHDEEIIVAVSGIGRAKLDSELVDIARRVARPKPQSPLTPYAPCFHSAPSTSLPTISVSLRAGSSHLVGASAGDGEDPSLDSAAIARDCVGAQAVSLLAGCAWI